MPIGIHFYKTQPCITQKLNSMKLIFATHNLNKLKEVKSLLSNKFEIVSLQDLNYNNEIPEPHLSFKKNALEKAQTIYNAFNENCFAEDSGLEIEALNGEPGVFSARYAGENTNTETNIAMVLKKMQHLTNRNAQFTAIIALIINGNNYFFEGVVKGTIATQSIVKEGFGYDPIFIPKGYDCTFSELSPEKKNSISHRGIAISKMAQFLNSK